MPQPLGTPAVRCAEGLLVECRCFRRSAGVGAGRVCLTGPRCVPGAVVRAYRRTAVMEPRPPALLLASSASRRVR